MVPQLEAAFQRVGLSITSANGGFKSTYQIMKELAAIWPKLNDIDRADLLEQVSGKRQGNVIASLLNNWKDAESALQTAMNSAGSALREHMKEIDSVEGRLSQFGASMSLVWQKSMDSDGFKSLIQTATSLADAFGALVDKVGLLPPVVATATIGFAAFNNGWRAGAFANMGRVVGEMTTFNGVLDLTKGKLFGNAIAMQQLTTATVGTRIGVTLLSGAMGTFMTIVNSFLPMLVLTAVSVGLQKLWNAWSKHSEEVRKAREEIEQATNSYRDNKDEITSLTDEYKNLKEASSLTTEQQKRLVEVQDKLASLLPDVAERFDAQGHAILKTAKAVDEYINSIDKLSDIKIAEEANNAKLGFEKQNKEIEKARKQIESSKKEKENPFNYITTDSGITVELEKSTQDKLLDNKRIIESEKNLEEAILDKANAYQKVVTGTIKGNAAVAQLKKTDTEHIKVLGEKYARLKANGELEKDDVEIAEELANKTLALARAREIMNAAPTYNELKNGAVDTYQYKLQQVTDTLKQAGIESTYASELMSLFTDQANKAVEVLYDVDAANKTILKTTDDFIGKQKDLAQAYKTLSDGEQLSLDTIISLTTQYPELIGELKNEGGILTLNKEKVLEIAKAKEAAFKAELKQKQDLAEIEKKSIEDKIKYALVEIGLIKSVDEVRTNASGMLKDYLDKNKSPLSMHDEVGVDSRYGLVKAFNDAEKTLLAMQKMVNDLNGVDFTAMLGKDAKSSGKDDSIPYNLNDYEHQDQRLANEIESFKYQAAEFEGKLDAMSMAQYKSFVEKQVEKFSERINLATKTLPQMKAEAEALLQQYNTETDQSQKNEFGHKYDATIKDIQQIENNMKDWSNTIRQLTTVQEKDKYVVDQYAASVEKLDQKLQESKNTQSSLKSTSQEYRNEITKQSDIIKQKMVLISGEISKTQSEIAVNKELLQSGNLLQSQFNELLKTTDEKEQKVRQLTSAYVGLNGELIQNTEAMKQSNEEWYQSATDVADKVIDGIKKALEAQKDLAVKAIDAIMEAEDKAHEKKMDELDDELKKFETITNAKLRSMDELNAKDDYEKELSKAQKERAETQKKIDLLSMDNSIESQAKLSELRKKLDEQDENILNIKEKREREVRKDGLKNELEAKQKDIEATKKTEDKKYEQSKETLEQMKKDVEYHFNELINDEERFSKIRENILKGDVEAVKTELNNYSQTFKDVANGDFTFLKEQLGTYWAQFETLTQGKLNTIGASIKENLNLANQLNSLISGTIPPGRSTPEGGLDTIGTPPHGPSIIDIANGISSGLLPSPIQFLNRLGMQRFDSGGYTGDDSGLALLHKKEIVLNEVDTKNLLATIQAMNIVLPRLKTPTKSDVGGKKFELNIENFVLNGGATKKDAENFIEWTRENMKKRGV